MKHQIYVRYSDKRLKNPALTIHLHRCISAALDAQFDVKLTKKGTEFGILKLEDESGTTELRMFGRTFIDFARFCRPMAPLLVTGRWQRRFRDSDISFEIVSIRPLDDIKGKLIRGITIQLTPEQCTGETLDIQPLTPNL